MARSDDLETIADACIASHVAIKERGTPEMLFLIRALLFLVGREIAQCEALPPSPEGQGREKD